MKGQCDRTCPALVAFTDYVIENGMSASEGSKMLEMQCFMQVQSSTCRLQYRCRRRHIENKHKMVTWWRPTSLAAATPFVKIVKIGDVATSTIR